jgi:hypothetical protein
MPIGLLGGSIVEMALIELNIWGLVLEPVAEVADTFGDHAGCATLDHDAEDRPEILMGD